MFCLHCGHAVLPDANFCPTCGKAPASQPDANRQARIVRPRSPRLVAGVLSGVAIFYGWDIALTRVVYALLTVLSFGIFGVLAYLVAWVLLPDAQYTLPRSIR